MVATALLRRIITLLGVLLAVHGATASGGVMMCTHLDGSRQLETRAEQAACEQSGAGDCCAPAADAEMTLARHAMPHLMPPRIASWLMTSGLMTLKPLAFNGSPDHLPASDRNRRATTILQI